LTVDELLGGKNSIYLFIWFAFVG